jgi:hypothetical protein
MFIAYQYYCNTFKQEIKQHKTPELAFIFAQQYSLDPTDDITDLEYTWACAIELFEITKDTRISLYKRCQTEREMRKMWTSFRCRFQYEEPKLPTVPPLPE